MRIKFFRYLLVGILLTGLMGGCRKQTVGSSPDQPSYWPDIDWRMSTPEEQGLDSASILAMLQEIQEKDLQFHSVLIVRHGYLVTEVYFPPYTREIKHPQYSITKSVTSALAGMAVRDGYIRDIQENVLDFFPDIANETADEKLKEVSIEHLLTMSAGFNKGTLPDFLGRDASFDAVEHILMDNRVRSDPGEVFYYDSGLPHVLSAILQKTGGLTLEAYAQRNLFSPLGITDFIWEADPQGITNGSTGLSLRPQDMAKLGYLYLHNGFWQGESIVPAEWVQASTSRYMETEGLMNAAEDDGYGYYWWIDSFGGFSAHGFGGQFIYVLPGLDMVVVFTAGLAESDFTVPHQLLTTYLLPSVQSEQAFAADPQIQDQLRSEINDIQTEEETAVWLPEIAGQISGRTYRVLGLPPGSPKAFTLKFSGKDVYSNAILMGNDETIQFTGGLYNEFFVHEPDVEGSMLAAFKGYWQDERTFIEVQSFDLSTDAQFFTVTYIFDGNTVSIIVESSMNLFPRLEGTGEWIE